MDYRKIAVKEEQLDKNIQYLEQQLDGRFKEMMLICDYLRKHCEDLPDESLQKLLESKEESARWTAEMELLRKYPRLHTKLSRYHELKEKFYSDSYVLQSYELARHYDPELDEDGFVALNK